MRRFASVLALLTVAACGDSTGSTRPAPLDPHDFVGTWRLSVDASPGCWDAYAADYSISQETVAKASNGIMAVYSDFWFPGDPAAHFPVIGNINWGQGTFQLVFTSVVRGPGKFEGTSVSTSLLSGTYTDLAKTLPNSTAFCQANAKAAKL